MARLFADENFPLPVVEALRRRGHNVVTVADIGRANQGWPDAAVFETAIRHHRVLLTVNRLHTAGSRHPGIIACTENPDFEGLAERIHARLEQPPAPFGQFIRIYQPSRNI